MNNARTADACKGQYTSLRSLYPYIKEYINFTGGEGDGDMDPLNADEEAIEDRLGRMSRANKKAAVEKLPTKTVQLWLNNPWYELFDYRYSSFIHSCFCLADFV